MSWDIRLTEEKLVEVEVADIGNYTWNVSPMYVDAMGVSLSYFDGKLAKDCVRLLAQGVANMVDDPDKYLAMEPDNGWGHYDGALRYLHNLLNACIENPNATIEGS